MACKLEEAVQEINKLLALPAVNKEKIMVDKLNLAKQSIEAQIKLLGAQKISDTGIYAKSSMSGVITVYHGTNVPIKAFDKSKAGGAKDSKLGHFFTDSLETAVYYGVLKKYPKLATNEVAQDDIIEEVMKDPFNYQKHGIYIVSANINLDNSAEANRDGKQKDFTAEAAKEKENALSKYDVLIDRNVIDGKGLSNTYLVRDVDNIQIINNSKINISSGTKGLPGALTNHTVLSKKKGSIESDYPIEFNGTKYDSVESAYQDNKVDESKTKPAKTDSQNYKLMVELIGAKFANHPRLVSAVTKLGGLKYLENAVHQPTSKNTVWETGGQDWFMSAMKEAYNKAITELVKVVDQIEVKEEAKLNKSESTEVLFDSKELKTEDKVYQLLSIYKDKDAPKIGGGMIDNTIIEKYERDEDKPNAEMIKGSQDSTLKDMLPYVDGRTITAWGKAADKWYKEQNRKPAVRKHVEDMLKVIAQIENEPKLIDELNWGNTKQEVGKMTTNEINEMALNCAK